MDYDSVQLAGDGEIITTVPYVAWRPEDTRVVSYLLNYGDDTIKPTRRGWKSAATAAQARREVVEVHGEILEENAAGDSVFFRVRRSA